MHVSCRREHSIWEIQDRLKPIRFAQGRRAGCYTCRTASNGPLRQVFNLTYLGFSLHNALCSHRSLWYE
jgi:hypothetical protein